MYINITIMSCAYMLSYRYMSIPQWKSKVDHLKNKVHIAKKQVCELEKKLEENTALRGIVIDDTSSRDLISIMEENNTNIHKQFAEGTFQRIFGSNNFRLQG